MKETEKRIGTRRLMNISARIKAENYGAEKGLCRGNSWKRTCRGFRFTKKKRGNRRSVSGTVSTPVLHYFLVWSRCRPTFFLMAYLLPDLCRRVAFDWSDCPFQDGSKYYIRVSEIRIIFLILVHLV